MKVFRSALQQLKQPFPSRTEEQRAEAREVRPFFIIVTGILLLFAVRTAIQAPALRTHLSLIAFLALMLLQIVLHWLSPRVAPDIRWSVAYFALQGAIAFAATVLSNDAGVALGLFVALIGEAVGMLRNMRFK